MKHLLIMNYRREVLGVFSVDSGNRLKLHLFSDAYQQEFKQLIKEITSNIPLPLHTYEHRTQVGNNQVVSKIVHLQPSNPDYLWAVREYLVNKKLGGTPILGQIIDKPNSAVTLSHQKGGTE